MHKIDISTYFSLINYNISLHQTSQIVSVQISILCVVHLTHYLCTVRRLFVSRLFWINACAIAASCWTLSRGVPVVRHRRKDRWLYTGTGQVTHFSLLFYQCHVTCWSLVRHVTWWRRLYDDRLFDRGFVPVRMKMRCVIEMQIKSTLCYNIKNDS